MHSRLQMLLLLHCWADDSRFGKSSPCRKFIQDQLMLYHCKFSLMSAIHRTLTLNYMILSSREVKGRQLLQKLADHMPLAKMYHSVASWIIEQQNCNFRDQCPVSTLFPFQSEQLIIHICCTFRLLPDSLLNLKAFSKDCRKWKQIIGQKFETHEVDDVPARAGQLIEK